MAVEEQQMVPGDGADNALGEADRQLSELLVEKGRLKEPDLSRARRLQEESGESLVPLMVKLGLLSERDVAEGLAEMLELPLLGTKDYPDVPVTNGQLPERFLKQHHLVPLHEDDDTVVIAMADPRDAYPCQALGLATGKTVEIRIGVQSEIDDVIERFYGGGRSAMGQIVENLSEGDAAGEDDVEHLRDLASEAPVIRLVNLVIQRAVEARASDIHIEPFENRLKVRYRIDGVLQEVEAPPSRSTSAVISRIKIMSKLNIAERRLPQDGRIMIRVQGKELDLRVSTIPTVYGESVVMRLLDRESVVLDFHELGFDDYVLKPFMDVLHMPHGIILVTGPTGSGKTTTLYTALEKLNTPARKIITVEDPVEYQLEGVNQIQVKHSIGLTFSGALRSIVRQDPDVIMIGEMRDLETAQIAIQSALTGHVVLSTVHTNDAAGGITRLLDMGVEDYLMTSTVNGLLAQRLVRKVCMNCREPYEVLPEMVKELNLNKFVKGRKKITLYHAKGCEECLHTGYRGRMGIYEFLVVTDPIRRLILQHVDSGQILEQAYKEGMRGMYDDGLVKCLEGNTTVEEILRVTQEA